jgi:hypothetical protein
VRAERRSRFRRFVIQLGLACLVGGGAAIALAIWLHPGFLALTVLSWVPYLTVVSWARCRACGRFLAQDPFFRNWTLSIPERCPHCDARVP